MFYGEKGMLMARSIAAPLATVFLCLSSGPTSTPLDAAISDTAQITRGTENRPLEAIDLASLRDVGPPFPDPRHHFIALSPNRRKVAFQEIGRASCRERVCQDV